MFVRDFTKADEVLLVLVHNAVYTGPEARAKFSLSSAMCRHTVFNCSKIENAQSYTISGYYSVASYKLSRVYRRSTNETNAAIIEVLSRQSIDVAAENVFILFTIMRDAFNNAYGDLINEFNTIPVFNWGKDGKLTISITPKDTAYKGRSFKLVRQLYRALRAVRGYKTTLRNIVLGDETMLNDIVNHMSRALHLNPQEELPTPILTKGEYTALMCDVVNSMDLFKVRYENIIPYYGDTLSSTLIAIANNTGFDDNTRVRILQFVTSAYDTSVTSNLCNHVITADIKFRKTYGLHNLDYSDIIEFNINDLPKTLIDILTRKSK